MCPRRSFHRSDFQRFGAGVLPGVPALPAAFVGGFFPVVAFACQRWIGSTYPDGSVSPRPNTLAMRLRSSGSFSLEFSGVTFSGRLPSFRIQLAGSS
jgi:hypothetical protein